MTCTEAARAQAPSAAAFDPAAWAAEFHARRGRRPRVLHIGNIAANAYNNAKLMRVLGFDCDVLCADYYHMMGCPEWEDADFVGDIGDHFAPDWTAVDLKGFARPRWFVQGPIDLCLDYLIAEGNADPKAAESLWRKLGVLNRTRRAGAVERIWKRVFGIERVLRRTAQVLRSPVRRARAVEYAAVMAERWRSRSALGIDHRSGRMALLKTIAGWSIGALMPIIRALLVQREAAHASERHDRQVAADASAIVGELCADFASRFPDRPDLLTAEDVKAYTPALPKWQRAFENYDVIQGYATDAIHPMLARRDYCAFEHGTLREIPFRPDTQGRMTALAYARASHVFVTNSDCMENARKLAGLRASALPHPFDEDRALRVSGGDALRADLQRELRTTILAFFPTRHDWVEGTGFADKANDRFFRALARLRTQVLRVGVICCEWGRNVAESRLLLRELGLEDSVKWVAPMGVVRYERHVQACDIVVDQFLLGAFGGVTFRGLAAGRPVLTWLREEEVAASFGSCPPILNCRTEDEIASVLREALVRPDELKRIGRDARRWVEQRHSGYATAHTQLREYARIIESRFPEVAPAAREGMNRCA